MVIYKVTNKENGKIYIGQTARPLRERMLEHARHTETVFDKAVNKYGIDNFTIVVIDKADDIEELNLKEIFWIGFYKSFGKNGYNLCEGGGNTVGYRHTDQAKEKMSKAKKEMYIGENNPFFNKHHTEETRARWSELRKGRKLTEEWKRHIAENCVSKRKCRNIETGEVFNSIKEAAEKYNIVPTHITRVCRGRRKKTGGFHWEYV